MAEPIPEPCPLRNDKLVVCFPEEPREQWMADIRRRYPGLDVAWARSHENGQYVKHEDYPPGFWDGVTLLCCDWLPPPVELLSGVRFVQTASSGTDIWKGHAVYENTSLPFCNASGVHPPQIAEWVISTWLAHQHHLFRYKSNMETGHWEKVHSSTVEDSTGLRMGILGYGAIGRQCARVAKAIGMNVYAYTRSERSTPESRRDDGFCVAGTGDPEGVVPAKWFHGDSQEAVNNFLAQDLDVLVVSLPLTESTRGIISAEQFEILSKRKTFVVNVARGPHVDTQALIDALEKGQIRGAAIDVTDPEPLPADHPLWKAPNLFLSPHVSWQTTMYWSRVLDILELNLENLSKGRPCINQVNR